MSAHYKSIQAGRAVAALMVVLFHLGGTLSLRKYFGIELVGRIFSFGHAGVHFFFVLSGFIIMYIHMDDLFKPEKVKAFLIKRCIRIYPIYWLIFVVVFISALAVASLRSTMPNDSILIFKALALFPLDKGLVGGTGAPVLIVAWSLQYEVYFYALFCTAIFNRWLALAVASSLVVGLVFSLGNSGFPADFIWSSWIVLFFLGVGVAVLVRHNKVSVLSPVVVFYSSLAVLASLVILEFFGGAEVSAVLKIFWGLGFAGLIFGSVRYEKAGRPLPSFVHHKSVQLLGDASYFLYLFHFPLISLLCKVVIAAGLSGVAGAVVAFVVIAFACLAFSVAGHLWIEKPMQMWLSRKLIGRHFVASPVRAA